PLASAPPKYVSAVKYSPARSRLFVPGSSKTTSWPPTVVVFPSVRRTLRAVRPWAGKTVRPERWRIGRAERARAGGNGRSIPRAAGCRCDGSCDDPCERDQDEQPRRAALRPGMADPPRRLERQRRRALDVRLHVFH